jgi:hypothetical protein
VMFEEMCKSFCCSCGCGRTQVMYRKREADGTSMRSHDRGCFRAEFENYSRCLNSVFENPKDEGRRMKRPNFILFVCTSSWHPQTTRNISQAKDVNLQASMAGLSGPFTLHRVNTQDSHPHINSYGITQGTWRSSKA